jgi:uncharacterized protein (DUF488 family)
MKKTIYTLGYQTFTHEEILSLMRERGVKRLVDVRTTPYSKKPGFTKDELEAACREQYEWRGDILGGKGDGVSEEGIRWLVEQEDDLLLMCMEDSPCQCHRYWLIARKLLDYGIECVHIYEGKEHLTSGLSSRCGEHVPWETQGKRPF